MTTNTSLPKSEFHTFTEGGACLNILRPDPPRPWPNFIYGTNGDLQVVVDQRGRGRSFYRSEGANTFSLGRNYVLRDEGSGQAWSLNAGDAPSLPERYHCAHRAGATCFTTRNAGIEAELLITVAGEQLCELNRIELRNTGKAQARLSLIGLQRCVLNGLKNDNQLEATRFDPESGAMLAQKRHFNTADYKYAAYYLSDRRPDAHTGSLESIFTRDTAPSEAAIWTHGELPGINAHATEIALGLQHHFELAPGEHIRIDFVLGLADDFADATECARGFFTRHNVDQLVHPTRATFEQLSDLGKLNTGEPVFDLFLNHWSRLQLDRQLRTDRGAATHNWRNNLQDGWGWMVFAPGRARQRLRDMLSLANEDGFLRRTSLRIPEAGGLGHYLSQRHGDIGTWTAMLAGRYAAETADFDFFRERIDYADGQKQATVIEGVMNAVQWLLDHKGRHGMILMLDGDWSDPLEEAGREGIGESPWTSVALVHAIRCIDPLLRALDKTDQAEAFAQAATDLAEAVNQHAWDGGWYIRGITDEGLRFCTKDDPDAKVSLMMQAWPLIAGVVPEDRKAAVLEAIDGHIETEIGPILYGPPFLQWRPAIGRETVKQPGTGENGSVYVHATMMLAYAEITAGRPDAALRMIRRVLPARDPDTITTTRDVPLWMPNFYHGPHSSVPGCSSGIFGTGALAWFFLVVYEGFLGIRPQIDGLEIRPTFPSDWSEASATRRWRGADYTIHYRRVAGLTATELRLDGRLIADGKLPIPEPRSQHHVDVHLAPAPATT